MQRKAGVSKRSTGFGLRCDAVVHRGLQLGGLERVLRHRALPMAQGCQKKGHIQSITLG